VAFWGDDGEYFQLSVVFQGQKHSRGQNSPFPIQCRCYLHDLLCVIPPATYNYIVPYVTGPVEHSVYICILLHSYQVFINVASLEYPVYMWILLHFLPSVHQCSFSGTFYIYVFAYYFNSYQLFINVASLENPIYICAYYFTSYQVFINVVSLEHPVYLCLLLNFLPSINQCSFSGSSYIYMCILLQFVPSIHQCSFSGIFYIYMCLHITSILTNYSSM